MVNGCIYISLYNIARHPPIHAHIHTPTAVSAMHGDSQAHREQVGLGASLRDTSTLRAGDRTGNLAVNQPTRPTSGATAAPKAAWPCGPGWYTTYGKIANHIQSARPSG